MGTKKQRAKAKEKNAPEEGPQAFPIVAIGASAGGLEAFTEFLRELPVNTGMAFVLIQHLPRSEDSLDSGLESEALELGAYAVLGPTAEDVDIEWTLILAIRQDAKGRTAFRI